MAVSLRQTSVTPSPVERTPGPAEPKPVLAHAYLARLSALYDEAAQTAHLANLLGRAPWAAGVLGVGALATALATAQTVSTAGLVTWLLLIAAGVVAMSRAYGRAIEAPFERAILKGFAQDVSATLLYAGFAWGAGLFLALPADIGILPCVAFTAGMSIVLACLLRARDVAFCFLVPATAMGAFAAPMRPLEGNAATMLAILAGGLAAAGIAALAERLSAALPSRVPQPG
jgi:hypothetical protein